MNKYIGLDMDSKKTVACVIQAGRPDWYKTLGSDVESLRRFLQSQKAPGYPVHAAFEISGQAGYLYDYLVDCVDALYIVNPCKATWIYRTAKKNDRIDARKIAVMMRIAERLRRLVLILPPRFAVLPLEKRGRAGLFCVV